MSNVIFIKGEVKYQINLDPSVWILDKRHFSLHERIPNTEGLAIELSPFFKHAELNSSAKQVICHRQNAEPVTISLEKAQSAYLCFAKNQQPIQEGGPVLLYFADGSNRENPIRSITQFEITT